MKPIRCQYCGCKAKIVTGAKLYPDVPRLALRQFARCDPCDAHVGFHEDGRVLGDLANRELRTLRILAHRRVDGLWLPFRRRRKMRRVVYAAVAKLLGIDVDECHIAQLSFEQLELVIIAVKTCQVSKLIQHATDRERLREADRIQIVADDITEEPTDAPSCEPS